MIMRKFLLLFLLFTAFIGKAQNTDQNKHDYFCSVVYSPSFYYISFPEEKEYRTLVDCNGEYIKFNNISHLLNFMSLLGWKIVNIHTYETGHTEVIYVKELTSDKESKDGLFLGDYPYKKKKK